MEQAGEKGIRCLKNPILRGRGRRENGKIYKGKAAFIWTETINVKNQELEGTTENLPGFYHPCSRRSGKEGVS